MVKGDKVRLNHELLLFAGFTFANGVWSYPDGETVDDGVPFFPDDETTCFKWLVPKVRYQIILKNIRDGWHCMLYNSQTEPPRIEAFNKVPALAFCLAVKDLIRSK